MNCSCATGIVFQAIHRRTVTLCLAACRPFTRGQICHLIGIVAGRCGTPGRLWRHRRPAAVVWLPILLLSIALFFFMLRRTENAFNFRNTTCTIAKRFPLLYSGKCMGGRIANRIEGGQQCHQGTPPPFGLPGCSRYSLLVRLPVPTPLCLSSSPYTTSPPPFVLS